MIVHRIASLTGALVLASTVGLFAAPTLAQESDGYSVSDVVKHFQKAPDLGRSRALCIGLPSECGAAEEPQVATPFNLQVQFEFNSATLTPEAMEQLDIFAEAATGALSRASFNIDGHTDASGSETVNLSLSEQRAEAVRSYLTARGVDPSRLIAAGHGEAMPMHDDPYHAGNRRVEASLATGQ